MSEEKVEQLLSTLERLEKAGELKSKLVKAEAKLKIYEAMFEKLNLNINLNQGVEEEE